MKHSSLLGQYVSYKENKCCEYGPWDYIRNTSFSFKLPNVPNKLECLSLQNLFSQVW